MADRQFEDLRQAELYDAHNGATVETGRDDFGFYLTLIHAVDSVLDVGCGTGALLSIARDGGHRGRLTGIDPANGMVTIARRRTDIDWIHGTLPEAALTSTFDLVVMSGHAFQVWVTDAELEEGISAVSKALRSGGRFAFETRNPAARAWERWTPENPWTFIQDGRQASFSADVVGDMDNGVVSFRSWFMREDWAEPEYSFSQLRFLEAEEIDSFLNRHGLIVESRFGDWDRSPLNGTSPEIITVARKP